MQSMQELRHSHILPPFLPAGIKQVKHHAVARAELHSRRSQGHRGPDG